jgi:hypothetical protein
VEPRWRWRRVPVRGQLKEPFAPTMIAGLVLLFPITLTYATSFGPRPRAPLTRPRSSGTLSREGRGSWLDGRMGMVKLFDVAGRPLNSTLPNPPAVFMTAPRATWAT